MENNQQYIEFLEKVIEDLRKAPVEGLCVLTKFPGNHVGVNTHNVNMMDKISFAGVLQQDATLDMLKANKLVAEKAPEKEEPQSL